MAAVAAAAGAAAAAVPSWLQAGCLGVHWRHQDPMIQELLQQQQHQCRQPMAVCLLLQLQLLQLLAGPGLLLPKQALPAHSLLPAVG